MKPISECEVNIVRRVFFAVLVLGMFYILGKVL